MHNRVSPKNASMCRFIISIDRAIAKRLKCGCLLNPTALKILSRMITKDIATADYLADLIRDAHDFELITAAELAIVCFRYVGQVSFDQQALNNINVQSLSALEEDG